MVERQKINVGEEKLETAEQEDVPLLQNHDNLSNQSQTAVSTTINEKECSVLSTKLEIYTGEKTYILRVRFTYLQLSEFNTIEIPTITYSYLHNKPPLRLFMKQNE